MFNGLFISPTMLHIFPFFAFKILSDFVLIFILSIVKMQKNR